MSQSPPLRSAIILAPEQAQRRTRQTPYLLPLVDKPFLQHCLEGAIRCGVRKVDILTDDVAELRTAFGNGERWGVELTVHPLNHQQGELQQIGVLVRQRVSERFLVLCGSQLVPGLVIPNDAEDCQAVVWTAEERWAGAALLSGTHLRELAFHKDNDTSFETAVGQLEETLELTVDSLQLFPARSLIQAQRRVLSGEFPQLIENLRSAESGVWIGRNTRIHPSVRIQAPAFIGAECDVDAGVTIGPNAVVSSHALLLKESVVADCVVTSYTSLGEDLHVQNCLVEPGQIYHGTLDTVLGVDDEALTGDLRPCRLSAWLSGIGAQAAGVIAYSLLSSLSFLYRKCQQWRGHEFAVVSMEYVYQTHPFAPQVNVTVDQYVMCEEACSSQGPLRQQWDDLLLRVAPALKAIIAGRLRWVGVCGRTEHEHQLIPDYWQECLRHEVPGIITESLIQFGPSCHEDQRVVCDMWLSVNRSPWQQLRAIWRYVKSLCTGPVSQSNPPPLATAPAVDEVSVEGSACEQSEEMKEEVLCSN